MSVPEIRIRTLNDAAINRGGKFVVYWMIAFRRGPSNFALQRAVELATDLNRPILVMEGLRAGYQWASDRFHRFVINGMTDNAAYFASRGVTYYPYLEPEPGAGGGLISELSRHACAVVTDDFPSFFLPRMITAAAVKLPVRAEAVDANGLLPLRASPRTFLRAVDFRRFLQTELPPHLLEMPREEPLDGPQSAAEVPAKIEKHWPAAKLREFDSRALAKLPIDHVVGEIPGEGGAVRGAARLQQFLAHKLGGYEGRNQPDADVTSRLSPYLHFGHVSPHAVFRAVAAAEEWSPARLTIGGRGARSGWWKMSPAAEAFLDQIVTWRELGYNMASREPAYTRYSSLPEWARATLAEHARDPRPYCYELAEFESAATHDDIWNAAQRQLVQEGLIHNYLRMLWAKKILHWSASPQEALRTMVELNNKYALDGRNPNSYSGIFWCLGRYDRAWGPERPVFGKIRYMSSENTARKLRLASYLQRFGGATESQRDLFAE